MYGMGSLMRFGGEDEDDFFGAHMQGMNQMSQMMNSMFSNPFGMMGGMGGFGGSPFMAPMMPQMPNMNQMMSQMQNNGDFHSYSSSTVMSMSNGPDGRPQVYQASSSTRSAPGGIRETKKAVCDSRTGMKKMAIGHAIGDKAHIIEREQNLRSGEQEERQDFINLDEEEGEAFNQEWQQKARQAQLLQHSIDYPQGRNSGRRQEPLLALPDCESSSRHSGDAGSPSHRPQLTARHHQLSGQHSQRHQPAIQQSNQSGYPNTARQQMVQQSQSGYPNSGSHKQQQQVQHNQAGYHSTVGQSSRQRQSQHPAGSVETSPLTGSRKRDHSGADKSSPSKQYSGDMTRVEVNTTTPAPEPHEEVHTGYSGEKKLKTRE